jgi:hypothetical protein
LILRNIHVAERTFVQASARFSFRPFVAAGRLLLRRHYRQKLPELKLNLHGAFKPPRQRLSAARNLCAVDFHSRRVCTGGFAIHWETAVICAGTILA